MPADVIWCGIIATDFKDRLFGDKLIPPHLAQIIDCVWNCCLVIFDEIKTILEFSIWSMRNVWLVLSWLFEDRWRLLSTRAKQRNLLPKTFRIGKVLRSHGRRQGGRGMRTIPFREKSLKLTVKIRYIKMCFKLTVKIQNFGESNPPVKK
jgi:hypothetical protein